MKNNTLLYFTLLFILVILIYYNLSQYVDCLVNDLSISTKSQKKRIENLVLTDSTYSNCKVGCLIACSDKNHYFVPKCYKPCVDQCWNY